MAKLSVVSTPIGNLEDITLRALSTLRAASLVLCEDTRTTKVLLSKHGIHVPTRSYHAHSALSRIDEVIAALREGKDIALVSDAGTPGISDPGSELVKSVRKELKAEIDSRSVTIEAIPGPSALTAALSIAGVPCADFVFLGFLPHKKGRETLFKEIRASERTVVFYESPHRISKSLAALAKKEGEAGSDGMTVTICREMTKIFEEVVQGTPEEVEAFFISHPDKVRGEFVVIVSK